MTEEEKEIVQAGVSWRKFGDKFGWTLYGWSFDHTATFILSDHAHIQIGKTAREDIEKVFDAAKTIDVCFPGTFAQDHMERDLPCGAFLGERSKGPAGERNPFLSFRCNKEELEEWLSDSQHYSDCASTGWNIGTRGRALGLQSSARATVSYVTAALAMLEVETRS